MTDLRELYQEMILDHGRHPRHYCDMPHANRQAQGFNQHCGDRLMLYLHIENEVIKEISFTGSGCAISMASASLMSEILQGKTVHGANLFFQFFHEMLTAETATIPLLKGCEKLAVFSSVKLYPARVKCATLSWHTLRAAFTQKKEAVSTEM